MYKTLIELSELNHKSQEAYDYEIKKFIRKKIDQSFKAYFEKNPKYSQLNFKRRKVKYMTLWGIDDYTAYHITELFDEEVKYNDSGKVIFPKRGKNIPEEILMKIIGNMEIDANWFFNAPLNIPVKFLTEKPQREEIKQDEIKIPVYNDLPQLTQLEPRTVKLNRSILEFLGLDFINSNHMHPIFKYYNYVFAKIKNSYYLTDLWNQDLKENETFLIYRKNSMEFAILNTAQDELNQGTDFVLGRVLTSLNKMQITV